MKRGSDSSVHGSIDDIWRDVVKFRGAYLSRSKLRTTVYDFVHFIDIEEMRTYAMCVGFDSKTCKLSTSTIYSESHVHMFKVCDEEMPFQQRKGVTRFLRWVASQFRWES